MSSTSGSAQDAGGQEGAGSGLGGQSDMEGKSPAPSSHSMQVCSIQSKYIWLDTLKRAMMTMEIYYRHI